MSKSDPLLQPSSKFKLNKIKVPIAMKEVGRRVVVESPWMMVAMDEMMDAAMMPSLVP